MATRSSVRAQAKLSPVKGRSDEGNCAETAGATEQDGAESITEAPQTESFERVASRHLFARLALLAGHVERAVAARRAVDPSPDDGFRGLYVSDDDVNRILAGGWPSLDPVPAELAQARSELEAMVDQAEDAGWPSRLRLLQRRFSLDPLDVDLLVVALAPDIEARFERLYGYLNDDVTRRRATIGLALELCGVPPGHAAGRARLRPGAPLVDGGLVIVEEQERPFLTRSLRVPDRVAGHLLGDDSPDRDLAELLLEPPPKVALDTSGLVRALEAGAELIYLRERSGSAGRSLALSALADIGMPALDLDLARVDRDGDLFAQALAAGREARMLGAGIVAGPIEALAGHADAIASQAEAGPFAARGRLAVRAFADLPVKVILLGRQAWDPASSRRVPLVLNAPVPTSAERTEQWAGALKAKDLNGSSSRQKAHLGDLPNAVAELLLAPEQVARAAEASRWQAAYAGVPLDITHVRSGARSQNAAGLERMARRIEPAVSWEDLVLPPTTIALLRELASRVHHREQVLDRWGMRPGGGRGRGVTALFAGESGTGKTMSAEVVAGALGLDLYTVNLATVVDKYVGETEKNLERIFVETDGVNGVLLFDEADALFGKRSDVKDAHDRYANIEVAYLLQRIETFDGLAILATNLRANVDEAFTRRLDAVIDFPFPDVEHRLDLWKKALGSSVPLAPDVDLEFLARSFELSGGNIRNIALTAAYLACDGQKELDMADMVRAVHREYRKLGRLSVESEFGPWFKLISSGM